MPHRYVKNWFRFVSDALTCSGAARLAQRGSENWYRRHKKRQGNPSPALKIVSEKPAIAFLFLPGSLFVPVSTLLLFPFMGVDFMPFSFFSAGHR